jgi:hypothetical protein
MSDVQAGQRYHGFKAREAYIIHKIDTGIKRLSVPEREEDDNVQHNEVNTTGRLWSF